jgi:hypothetical protein
MNEIEPTRVVRGQIVARTADLGGVIETAWPLERYRLRRRARCELFEEELAYLRRTLRLQNLAKLTRQSIEYHLELAEDIAARMASTDNPLVQLALQQAFDSWLAQSRQILSGLTF